MKALVIGFPKSGTSTIHEACTASGLTSAHWRIPAGYCGQLIYQSHMRGQDPLADFEGFDVIAQADVCDPKRGINFWPNLDISLLLNIRRHHPECAFILNVRDPRKLVASISRWRDLRKRLTQADIIGLPQGYGDEDVHLINWICSHYAACRHAFGRDSRFIEIDIEDASAQQRLSAALDTELTWWGIANQNVSRETKWSSVKSAVFGSR